jgi:flagellar biosynthesis protein FliR
VQLSHAWPKSLDANKAVRVKQQMNGFIVDIPLKIALGMVFLSLLVVQFDPVVRQATYRFINDAGALLHAVGGG